MQDAADHPPVIHPLLAAYIRRQMRRDPTPLLIAQPKQIAAHLPDPPESKSLQRINNRFSRQHFY
jgi:hypothetical protein